MEYGDSNISTMVETTVNQLLFKYTTMVCVLQNLPLLNLHYHPHIIRAVVCLLFFVYMFVYEVKMDLLIHSQ